MMMESSFEQEKLLTISEMLVDKCEELFETLEVQVTSSNRMYIGVCPIHQGDNKSAFNFYSEGHTIRGNWCCRTHHCHKTFKPTIIGFVRGVLSSGQGWSESNNGKEMLFPWVKTIEWICNFLKVKWSDVTIKNNNKENAQFIRSMSVLSRKRLNSTGVTRDKVLANLRIPDGFFGKRDYDADLLKSYDVGYCLKSKNGFEGRVIVPIYDDDGKFMVAYTGRTVNPVCSKCGSYHKSDFPCPNKDMRHMYSKWKNSPGVNNYLYNYWRAKPFIKKKGKVVLVEGPPDVWKLVQLGVQNVLGIFGTDLTEEQILILEMSSAMNIIILTDADGPGRLGAETIKKKLQNSYNIKIPVYEKGDPGQFAKEDVEKMGLL